MWMKLKMKAKKSSVYVWKSEIVILKSTEVKVKVKDVPFLIYGKRKMLYLKHSNYDKRKKMCPICIQKQLLTQKSTQTKRKKQKYLLISMKKKQKAKKRLHIPIKTKNQIVEQP